MLRRLKRTASKKELGDRIQTLQGEASSIKLADGSVDLVVSNGVFHELFEPEAVLGEIIRILRPHGWIVVTDFRDTRIGKWIGASHRDEDHGPFSVDELESLFVKMGLTDVKVSPVKHWIMGVGRKVNAYSLS